MVNRAYARGVAVALAIAVVAIAVSRGPERPYEPLSPQVANLRTQFNADVGKVRILLLPAPT